MHWIDQAGHLARRGDGAIVRARLQGAPRDPRRAQLRLAHRAGADVGRGRRRRTSARTGSASTRTPTTTRRWRRCRTCRRATRACTATCRPTCNERIKEVLTGTSEPIVVRIFGPDLDVLRAKSRGGHRGDRRRSTASSTRTPSSRPTSRRSRSSSISRRPRRYGLKPGDVRRAVVDADRRARRSATSSAAARPTTCTCGAIPDRPQQRGRRRAPADRHAAGRAGPARRRGRRARSLPTPERRSSASGSSRRDRRRRQRRGPRPGVGRRATSRTSSRRSSSRSGTTPRCSASRPSATRPQDRLLLFGAIAAVAIFLLLQSSFGSRAAGGAGVPARCRSALVGGVLGGVARRRRALARLARRVPHGVRHRRAQRDPDDQPLPAPGARGRRAVRARARAARRPGAARADPDDRARDRAGARAAGRRRQHRRATRSSTRWPS